MIITLLTDFGQADGFAGIMKGVILAIAPAARLIDLSHQVPPQQLLAAALLLRSAVPYFPPGTIHLVVVDPGVGSQRKAIAIETGDGFLVGPDNGVLAPAAAAAGIRRVHEIDNPAVIRASICSTFHGRDVFAPAAAHLANGRELAEVGPAIAAITPLALPMPRCDPQTISGEVVYIDHFGNLITNIDAEALSTFRDHNVCVSIGGMSVAGPVSAYAAVAEGELLSIVNSWEVLEIAIRNGNAKARLNASIGVPVTVRRTRLAP